MIRLYLSEILDKDSIKNKNRLLIVAGVGAGKNTFFEQQFDDHTLIATSRAAKRIEGNNGRLYVDQPYYVTHHILATQWQEWCEKDTNGDFLPYINTIVIDEAHALITDSTFNELNYFLYHFLEHKESHKKQIILMTATPQPLWAYTKKNNYTIIDCRKTAKNVVPKRITVTTKNKFMQEHYGKPFHYYSTSKARIRRIEKDLIKHGIVGSKIAVNIAGTGSYEDNFVTLDTSAYREGINVHDDEQVTVACESINMLEAYQYTGRFRNGVEHLYILSDCLYEDLGSEIKVASFYGDVFVNNDNKLSDYDVCKVTSGYVRRNPLTNEFTYFSWKKDSVEWQQETIELFKKDIENTIRCYFGDEPVIVIDDGVDFKTKGYRSKSSEDDDKRLKELKEYIKKNFKKVDKKTGEINWYLLTESNSKKVLKKARDLGIRQDNLRNYKYLGSLFTSMGMTLKYRTKDKRVKGYGDYVFSMDYLII